jgi:hypothetical protein
VFFYYLCVGQMVAVGQQETVNNGHITAQFGQIVVTRVQLPLDVEEVGQLHHGFDVVACNNSK